MDPEENSGTSLARGREENSGTSLAAHLAKKTLAPPSAPREENSGTSLAAPPSQLGLLRLHARLASGWWLAFAGRALTRGASFDRFPLITYMAFSFPRLFLARWHLPRQSLDATSASALAGAAYARVDAGWKPARWVKIGLAGVAGTTFGRMKIRFAGNQAGTWGSVFLESLLVVGVEWE